MIPRTIVFFVVLTCSVGIVNRSHGQITLSDYQDSIYQYCDTASYGWYSSEDTMTNGDVFQIYLGPIDEELQGRYIEKNMWGTFYGTWEYSMPDMRTYDTQNKQKRECYVHINLNDTIVSQHRLHYDADEKFPCWWKTIYFYSNSDTSTTHYVEMRDRTGVPIPMFSVRIEDANHEKILCHDQHVPPITRCCIPPEARSIRVSGKDPDVAMGVCEYIPDSGDVVFVILPTANDYRLMLRKNWLEFHPLDQWCNPNSSSAVNLMHQSQRKKHTKTTTN